VSVARIPFLDGARETADAGILSSLHPANLAAERAIHDPERHRARPEYALLFDPQTAGGLLAGVPKASADACLSRLRAEGYSAASIGEVRATGSGPATIALA